MTATAKQLLVGARALIADPAHWTKGEYARKSDGQRVTSGNPNATCFCSIGALHRASHDLDRSISTPAVYDAESALTDCSPTSAMHYNDAPKTTHADVLKMFDCAIEGVK